MIKRPLNSRFVEAVRSGRKFTTIRDNPWPVGVPIMLYQWSGAAYRSKHTDVAVVTVLEFWPIQIHRLGDGTMRYRHGMKNTKPLYESEGFATTEELDGWFRPLVKPGQTVTKMLMRFRLATALAQRGSADEPQLYGMRSNYGMRKTKKVLPGWPQAVLVLTCGHRIIVPTWSDGRVNPKPAPKTYCEQCWHAEWDRRHAAAHPQSDQGEPPPNCGSRESKTL
jgi:hypothetical protein